MSATTRNEAAGRLDHLIGRWTASATKESLRAALDEALAAERRATVERIREAVRMASYPLDERGLATAAGVQDTVLTILDEEAAR